MLRRIGSLIRNLLLRDRMQRELDDELRAMCDLLVEDKIAREGMIGVGPRNSPSR